MQKSQKSSHLEKNAASGNVQVISLYFTFDFIIDFLINLLKLKSTRLERNEE